MKRQLRMIIFPLLAVLFSYGTGSGSAGAAVLPSEFVPGDLALVHDARSQTDVDVSSGAGTSLVVWADHRANTTGWYEGETSGDIFGLRVDAAGNLLDTVPIPIASLPASQTRPRAAWNGTSWLVVYETHMLGGTGYYYQAGLEAVRVSPDGLVLDPVPIRLYGLTPTGSGWDLASDGNNWVIVNQGTSTSGNIVAVRVSSSGDLLDPPVISLVKATYYMRSNFNLAYAAGVFMLTFNDEYSNGGYDTKAVRFDSELNLLDPAPLAILGSPLYDLASNGSEFYILWNRQLPNFSTYLAGSRMLVSGQLLDPNGTDISGSNIPQIPLYTRVAWDGAYWRAVWTYNLAARAARIQANGQVIDFGGIALPLPQSGALAGSGAGTAQMAWARYDENDENVSTAFLNGAGGSGAEKDVSIGVPAQLYSDGAWGTSGAMLVYQSRASGIARTLAQPLGPDGSPLTAEPVELTSSATPPSAPTIAWNGSIYLAAWSDSEGVKAVRLLQDGTILDPAPIVVLSPGFGPPDAAAIGDNFLVVGRRFGISIHYIGVIAARVRGSDGAVLDPTPVAMAGVYGQHPQVAVLGGRWLVAWQANLSHDDPLARTRGAFINADGILQEEIIIHGIYSTSGGNGIFSLGLASNGSRALMVQSQELTSGVETDVLGVFIEPDGTVAPYQNLTPWEGNQYWPRAAWDGENFIVSFQDQRNRDAAHSLEQLDARSDLFAMRITPTGTLLDPQGFLFSNSPVGEVYPNLAARNGDLLFLGSIMRLNPPWMNYRIGYQVRPAGNAWPVAIANGSGATGTVPLTVVFSSAGSVDPDGSIQSYSWDFGDGGGSTQANPAHTYTSPGLYTAVLTVTDDLGSQTSQTVRVLARPPNQLPVAGGYASPDSGPPPLSVVFYADMSYDPDGFIGNIFWEFSDGGSYYGSPAYHTFSSPGAHFAQLTVYDSAGATGTTTIPVIVGGSPTPTPTLPPPTPTPTAGAMHIGSIVVIKVPGTGNRYTAEASVTVLDAAGQPVSGALVAGNFTGATTDTVSGTTGADGVAVLSSSRGRGTADWTFCVAGVSKSGWVYDPAANLETCDGTGGPTPTPSPVPPQIHIGDLDGIGIPAGNRWEAHVTITVLDAFGQPVASAEVVGTWGGAARGSASCTTGADGTCVVTASGLRLHRPTATFMVDDVVHAAYTYNPLANQDPDGDSDGTTIVVAKP